MALTEECKNRTGKNGKCSQFGKNRDWT